MVPSHRACGFAAGLLSFRYTVGIFLSGHSRKRLGGFWICVLRPEQVRPPRRRFMTGNPDGSVSSRVRLRRRAALFPVYGWDFSEWSLEATLGWLLGLCVAAGA